MASDILQQNTQPNNEPSTALWIRRLIISLTVLIWIILAALFLWLIGHVIRTVILLAIGALIAYAIAPIVRLLQRIMPRWLAILLVYLILFTSLGIFLYYVALTAVRQVVLLARYAHDLLSPDNAIIAFLNGFGISPDQIRMVGQQVVGQINGVARDIIPFVRSLVDVVLDILVIAILSIYLLIDGSRIAAWLRTRSPRNTRRYIGFLLNLSQEVVGGYIRGQLMLAVIIGILVGAGMQLFGVPLALLLSVLAFLFEFAPIIGTIITGTISVLLALTHGWVVASLVLIYFLIVHAIEAYIIGPRILGQSVKIHPIVSLCAVITGGDLFGILGIIFAAPIAGILQAIIKTLYSDWRKANPEQFTSALPSLQKQEE